MNLKLETEFSKADILKEVDALKKQIDDMRPLPEDVEGRVMQKLRLDWNYNSNAIEGNKLTYGETAAFLSEGITAKGKPLKDHLDIKGHNEAINFLLDIVKETRPISEADIRTLHKMILVEPYEVKAQTASGAPTSKRISLGEYKTSPNHVKTSTGELHYYATPEETPAKMQELMEWYANVSHNEEIHPIVVAALFHHKFVAIHPFDDGNGRLSRILMNLILMQKGFPPVVIRMDDRQNYYSLLRQADVGSSWPFVEYIVERLQSSMQLYLKAAKGGSIDDEDDIDKGIELFKMELLNSTNLKEKRSNKLIEQILELQVAPLITKIEQKAKKFEDLFFEHSYSVEFDVNDFADLSYPTVNNFINYNPSYKSETLTRTESISLRFEFRKFKNLNNDFSIANWIKIVFGEYNYKFFNINDELILSKLYHENLTPIDEQKIIKVLIEDLKDNISSEIKSSES